MGTDRSAFRQALWEVYFLNTVAIARQRRMVMEVRDYCKNVGMELTLWKAKLYDVMHKMDQLPTGDKQRMYENVNDLHILMTELDDRLDMLRNECPTEWNPQREEIKTKLTNLESRYNDAAGTLFDYDFGG